MNDNHWVDAQERWTVTKRGKQPHELFLPAQYCTEEDARRAYHQAHGRDLGLVVQRLEIPGHWTYHLLSLPDAQHLLKEGK